MTDDEAVMQLRRWRWPPDGDPICPHCGGGNPYTLAAYKRLRCSNKTCRKDFSVTSGSMFSSPKLSAATIVTMVTMYCDQPYRNMRRIALTIGVDYSSAWNILRRLEGLCDGSPPDVATLMHKALNAKKTDIEPSIWAKRRAKNWG